MLKFLLQKWNFFYTHEHRTSHSQPRDWILKHGSFWSLMDWSSLWQVQVNQYETSYVGHQAKENNWATSWKMDEMESKV